MPGTDEPFRWQMNGRLQSVSLSQDSPYRATRVEKEDRQLAVGNKFDVYSISVR